MSDGSTEVRRDECRRELENKALPIEIKLLSEKATKKDIEMLLSIWNEWAEIPRGYWGISSVRHHRQRKSLCERLLKDGKVTLYLCD